MRQTGSHTEPIDPSEVSRLQALREYRILDTEPEELFDGITQLASRICEVPISLISLVDEHRQWFKSRIGISAHETPRSVSICAHAILEPGKTFEIPDLTADIRFQDNPLVNGDPNLAFYAGFPLVDTRGHSLGTLCVLDHRPRRLKPEQEFALRTLAQTVVALLEQRRKNHLFNYFYDHLGGVMDFGCPYYLFLSSQGQILRHGSNFKFNIPSLQEDDAFTDHFEWEQPMDLAAEIHSPSEKQSHLVFFRIRETALRFKGVYRVFEDFIVMLAYPVINSQAGIEAFNITLNDIPRHDYLSEYLFLQQTTQRSLKDAQSITEKLRQRNKELQEAQREIVGLSLFPSENPNPILRFDQSLKLIYSNSSAENFQQDFSIGKDGIGEEELRSLMVKIAESGLTLLNRYLERNGRIYSVWIRYVPDRNYINLYANDITRFVLEVRKTESELESKNRELESIRRDLEVALHKETELSQIKSRFITMTSHEFRTPLTTIQANAELVELHLRQQGEVSASLTKFLYRISREVSRLTNLMNDILLLGRIESGRLPFQPSTADLVHLVQEVLDTTRFDVKETRVPELQVEGEPFEIEMDVFLMNHVLTNLVSNAMKYSPGKPAPQVKLTFSAAQVELRVTDFGIGIPKADLDKTFDSFFRASNVSGFQGTGLGLAITRQFVDMHHGTIRISSEENVGTSVTVRLPARQP